MFVDFGNKRQLSWRNLQSGILGVRSGSIASALTYHEHGIDFTVRRFMKKEDIKEIKGHLFSTDTNNPTEQLEVRDYQPTEERAVKQTRELVGQLQKAAKTK
jgi:hypothetical protein